MGSELAAQPLPSSRSSFVAGREGSPPPFVPARLTPGAEKRAKAAYADIRAAARLGLSTVHNRPRDRGLYITAAVDGACVEVRALGKYQSKPPPQGSRGAVKEFSRRSRTRMMKTACSIPKQKARDGMLFVTLTYPRNYPGDWEVWKGQLKAWFQRLNRRVPRACGLWKLEPQKRGAPHFHLILCGVPYLAKEWVSQSWFETVGSADLRHLKAGTQVQQVKSHKGVISYAAKYAAKDCELPPDWKEGVGRYWGVHNRKELGIERDWIAVDEGTWVRAREVLWSIIEERGGVRPNPETVAHWQGMWLPLDGGKMGAILAALWNGETLDECVRLA